MKGNLPHLSAIISEFLSGALETWKHFTTEFTPDGMIGGATDHEKELAWVPGTIDANVFLVYFNNSCNIIQMLL